MEALAPTVRAIAELQRQIASNQRLMQSIHESTQWADRILPQLVKPLELAATAEVARMLSGPSALFTARVALAADFRLTETLARVQIPSVQIAALTGTSRAIASISEALVSRIRYYPEVERAISEVILGWRWAVVFPTAVPGPIAVDRVRAAGATTVEVEAAGAIIIGSPLLAHEEARWEKVPAELRDRMRLRLSEIDPGLMRKLDGVWERVSTPGPDAASQAANSLIELIDWFLRLVARDSDVLKWHRETQGPASQLTNTGQPTRALRVTYVLALADRDAKPTRRFTMGLLDMLEFLQGGKHGLEFDDVGAVTRVIPAVEALLTYFLI